MLKDYLALPLSHANHPVQCQKNSSMMLGSMANSSRLNQRSSVDHYDFMQGESNHGSPSRGQRPYLNSPSGLDNRPLLHSPVGGSVNDHDINDHRS